jgi:hypothetical protein
MTESPEMPTLSKVFREGARSVRFHTVGFVMHDRDSFDRRRLPKWDTILAKFAFAWLIPAIVLTTIELIAKGHITPIAVAFDAIAAIMLPFGLLSLAIAYATEADDGPPEEEGPGGGWGRAPTDEEPPPLGGLSIDWDAFEADFRTYADSLTTV